MGVLQVDLDNVSASFGGSNLCVHLVLSIASVSIPNVNISIGL